MTCGLFVCFFAPFTSTWTNNPSFAPVFFTLTNTILWQAVCAKLCLASCQPWPFWIGCLTLVLGKNGVVSAPYFYLNFASCPPFHLLKSLVLLSGWWPVLLGCKRPSAGRQKFIKWRVVIGLLSSPLGSGRPDLIRHQDGPLMDMSFSPFPPGGRNGSWRGRGETPPLIWSIGLFDQTLSWINYY